MTEITDRTHYTGYVVDGEAVPTNRADGGGDEVVVSAGGGAVGETLLRTAIAAKSGTVYRDLTWRFLAGHNMPNSEFDSIRAKAGAGIVVERARTDFPALLASSALSISQCGYNTMMELLNAGIRAVVVPFAGDGETEQSTRAQIWAVRGWGDGFGAGRVVTGNAGPRRERGCRRPDLRLLGNRFERRPPYR